MTKLEKWLNAPLAVDEIPDEVVCSCCNSKKDKHIMRYFVDGPGMICKRCYFSGTECTHTCCSNPAIYRSAYCRDHFMDQKIDPRTFMLNRALGSISVSAAYPEHEDRDGYRGYTQFRKDLDTAMEREGIPKRDQFWMYNMRGGDDG